jgi:hypothetical protein
MVAFVSSLVEALARAERLLLAAYTERDQWMERAMNAEGETYIWRERCARLLNDPNPAGRLAAEASLPTTGEASGPVGLGQTP